MDTNARERQYKASLTIYGKPMRCNRRLASSIWFGALAGSFIFPPLAWSGEIVPLNAACSFFGEKLPPDVEASPANENAPRLISKIVNASGLKQNFSVRTAMVPNASAAIVNGQRFILYNSEFMVRLAQVNGRIWPELSVLAHEIGHHLNGDTLFNDGSRPAMELQADYFSGYILQKLGAAQKEATTVMERFAPLQGSATHPDRAARVEAIQQGWIASCETDTDCMAPELPGRGSLDETNKDDDN